MKLYEAQFEKAFDFPPSNPRFDLLIAFTARCGSHMLGHCLENYKLFGSPFEYLNWENFKRWKMIFGTDSIADTLTQLRNRRTSQEGIFSTKLHWKHLEMIGGYSGLKHYFINPRIIYVFREDQIAQAVSLTIARQTGSFIFAQEPTGFRDYDFNSILRCQRIIASENAQWNSFLQVTDVPHTTIKYEDFLANPMKEIRKILSLCKIDSIDPLKPPVLKTKKQRDSTNGEWVRRFKEDWRNHSRIHGDLNLLHDDPRSNRNIQGLMTSKLLRKISFIHERVKKWL